MAEGEDEIVILCDYKQFKFGEYYKLKDASANDLVGIFVTISNSIEPHIYTFSGIDTKKIDSLINVGKGLSAVCSFLKTFKRDSLLVAVEGTTAKIEDKSKMLPIAESYLLNQLLTKSGVQFKPSASSSIKSAVEKATNQIAFICKYQNWLAIKKLGINSKTQDWEVAGILSSINHTIMNKAFDLEKHAEITVSGRKSISNLVTALEKADENSPYSICKTCEAFNYKPYATPEILMDAYPDIKPPKVKGRKPKG